MKWIKRKISKWVGLDALTSNYDALKRKHDALNNLMTNLVNIGVDVHFKEPHIILIYSRLKGGQLREISADFKNINELNMFVMELRRRFNTDSVVYDLPHGADREMFK